jgi:hypothetical protein
VRNQQIQLLQFCEKITVISRKSPIFKKIQGMDTEIIFFFEFFVEIEGKTTRIEDLNPKTLYESNNLENDNNLKF